MRSKIAIYIICMGAFLLGGSLQAQQVSVVVTGKVLDKYNRPVPGVTVNSANGRNGTATNAAGDFTLQVDDNSEQLRFYAKGYARQSVSVAGGALPPVILQTDAHKQDEVVQLGYSSQLRREVTGAVATVTGDVLERSPVANLTQTLAGRLPGLTTMETYSELSRANTNLFVRGISSARQNGPLVIIDGIMCAYNSNQTLEYISANEIESISILKDASTQALYGIQGANGVLVVTTKRGQKGDLKVNVRMDQSFQEVTTKPTFYHSFDYASMRNQAAENDGLGKNYLFSEEQLKGYKDGSNKELYPDNNWYEKYMNDLAMMQRVAVNVSAGSDKVQFFSNINVMHQGGQFKTDQTKYNPNANNVWVNYRSNLDMTLNKYIKAFLRLSGNVKRERTPGSGNSTIYGSFFQMPPTTYGPLTPVVTDPATGKIINPGGQVITTKNVGAPTYGMLNRSGYYRHTVTNIYSQVGLDVDMSFLTKGLSLTGTFAYQTNSVGSLGTTQNYERWMRTDDPDELTFIRKGSENNTPLAYGKSHSYYYHLTYNAMLNYQRSFGKHSINALGYMFFQNLTKADVGAPALLPYNRVSSGAEAAYAYDSRYFLKLDVGYSGSEQYARNARYIATPAVAVGWEVANEHFMSSLDWLSQLKLRASWGQTGNDQSGLARFAYLDNVSISGGGPIGYLQYVIKENQTGNPNVQAEVSTKTNAGIDLGLFHALTISVDVFKEKMTNMVVAVSSKVPLYQGVPLGNYPRMNAGTFENKGYEIALNYTKDLSRDLNISLCGQFSYQKNTIINWNEANRTADYAYRKREEGFSFGQEFGYLVDYSNGNGFFNSAEEITSSKLSYSMGKPRVGDLIYKDLNGDHIIDDRDKAPIGNGMLPRQVYAISGGVRYKAFDLNFLFQGTGEFSSIYGGQGVYETDYDGVFGARHANAWTPERYANQEPISYPALSLKKSVSQEANDFFSYNRSYIRLKNIEIGYTLPASVARRITAEKIRVLLSGQNLFTWHHMKSDDFGPEGGGYTSFPVYKVYNIGVSVGF
ncbi:SusC/RagA family TonB-linked outer membrane protein [Chitinophaga arvensicola]|uniref:TonB-linked outer membrane protein, SusC/RagA family n=1 Tax=Chitinophaga arvensicola TaxID=29529 RepID=A0A1I0S6X3_9BACT|nr:SusC/RagA family TonB-linked outer membrane protein [Chitinophaga arvensicola]SEW51242.1 TonB-linked outer membrane protein, SusC/RagA family [Chitinophaga arvensicola]